MTKIIQDSSAMNAAMEVFGNTPEPAHSPKGASSAERWMNCSGSSALLKGLSFPETDEPEWTSLGTAAHALAWHCLIQGADTWEMVGMELMTGHKVDQNMADAVQEYLGYCRQFMLPGVTTLIETRIGEKPENRPHPDFYGTVDFSARSADWLRVVDYKHGEGIVVEPFQNTQMKYYAFGLLHERRRRGVDVRRDLPVILAIVQPRAFHIEGGIREWETTAGEIMDWGDNVLIPQMNAVEIETEFNAGSWCRFCPAKLFCPLLTGLFGAAAKTDPKIIPALSAERLGLEYEQREAVKFYMKALDEEVYRRNMTGNTVPGTKLVYKKANRVFREGAAPLFKTRFGDAAFSAPELLTPAQMEKISDDAKKLVKEWAFMPVGGLTVAHLTDKRTAVTPEKITDTFAHYAQEMES